jgi:hypothetical protein
MQVAQAGRPGDPRDACAGSGSRAGSWDRPAMFPKIFQKFACLDEDLPKENLP